MLLDWGIRYELAAPSVSPRPPSEDRKTARRDVTKLARAFRDDRPVPIHIPSEEEERVRDRVRCRETFQREILKSRLYILTFIRRRASFTARAPTGPRSPHELDPPGPEATPTRYGTCLEVPTPPLQSLSKPCSEESQAVAGTAGTREMVSFLWTILRNLHTSEFQNPEVNHAA